MKALAWIALILASILALASFLVLIDLIAIEIATGNIYAYEDIALALVVFCGSAYVTLRSFRAVRSQRHHVEVTNPH